MKTSHAHVLKAVVTLTALTVLAGCGEAPVVQKQAEEVKYPVAVTQVQKTARTEVIATGTAESKRSTQVFAPAAGVVAELYVREGTRVSRGTPLFRVGGVNGTAHPIETQMKNAFVQANAAVASYNNTIKSNSLALSGAYLNYYSAVNQTQASQVDQRVFEVNKNGLTSSLTILNDSLTATRTKTAQDKGKLQDTLVSLNSTLALLNNNVARTNDPAQRAALTKQITDTRTAITQTETAIAALDAGLKTAENQLLAQIAQNQTQQQVLDLNQQSVSYKLGLTATGSFPEAQGELGVSTAENRNEGTLTQAKTQVQLAKSQYESLRTQYESLTVRAQSSGVVSGLDLNLGSPVNPQAPAATIIDGGLLTADIGVSENDAYRINAKTPVEVLVGSEFKPSRIVSISPQVDPVSKKVMVTISVPANTIRVNGTVTARFMLAANLSREQEIFVPLDSVIISTEETFVFIVEDGKAVKKTVKTGALAHDTIHIVEGLTGGETIITQGAKDVFDGQPVSYEQH